MLVDEADIDNLMAPNDRPGTPGASSSGRGVKRSGLIPSDFQSKSSSYKRKRGPLPRHIRFKRWRNFETSDSESLVSAESSDFSTEDENSKEIERKSQENWGKHLSTQLGISTASLFSFAGAPTPNGVCESSIALANQSAVPLDRPEQEKLVSDIQQSVRCLIRKPGRTSKV